VTPVGRVCVDIFKWRFAADDVLESEEPTVSGDWHLISHFLAMPEDSLDGVLMYGGRLLFRLDELTFIEACPPAQP